MANDGNSKKRIIRWRGVLGECSRTVRMTAAALLTTAGIAVVFSQLGFAEIGLSGGYATHAFVLLLPVAAAALLLGTPLGTLIGLITGAALYLHAKAMPLDFFELSYINLVTSVVMLTIVGFLLGVLFAFVLRNNPSGIKRYVYIAIVCIVVSFLYSFGFQINVVVSLTIDLALEAGPNTSTTDLTQDVQDYVAAFAYRMGNSDLQAWVDGLLMLIACLIADAIARKSIASPNGRGLRGLFGAWLSVVVLFVFMLSSTVSFIAITSGSLNRAEKDLNSEVTYLANQLESSNERTDSLLELINSLGGDLESLSDEDMGDAVDAISIDSLLTGYTVDEDGLVVISYWDNQIALSDDPQIKAEDMLDDCFDKEELEAIERSIESGEMQRIVHDDIDMEAIEAAIESGSAEAVRTKLMYLVAKEVDDMYVIIAAKPTDMVFASRDNSMVWMTAASLTLLLAVFVLTARLLSTLVARRIDETNGVLQRITHGDLDARVEAGGTREFESLSEGINDTVDAMKGLIAEAEARMNAELATAKAIQEAALPRIFPPFPDILRFDVYATMEAAREVGGDFYDFFLVGEESSPDGGKLGFVVADVSGKGVPAALFMMKAKALIRDYIASGMELGEAFENANRQLCDGNDASMFVTAWAGVLDYATGHVDFVSAGHNPPLIWQLSDARWHWLKEKSGLPLGLFDGMPYTAHSIECQVGDQFLLYTDGVTEAMDTQGRQYGEDRLKAIADENYPMHPRELVKTVRSDVAAFAGEAEQSDDITILALEVGVPPEITATLVIPADVKELPQVNEFIHDELDRRLCPMRAQNQLDIAVEELFVNVAHYAYPEATPDNPGMARVSYTYSADPPSITVDIADDGIPYNPLAKPDAVTPDDIMEVPIGGLGILMAKRSVDEMRYARVDGSNIVTIVKKW